MVVMLTVKKTNRKVDGKVVFEADGSKMGSSGLVVLLPEDASDNRIYNAVKKAAKVRWPNADFYSIVIE